jgi:gliding motility-associated-like protein
MRSFRLLAASLFILFLNSVYFTARAQVCNLTQLPSNLRNGLVAWYPFCGNANDVSGNGLNGTVFGATITTDRFSGNTAYSFNGSSYIRVNNSPLINFGTGSFTLSCWVLSTGSNRWQHFITHTEPTSTPYSSKGYALRYDNNQPTYIQGNTFNNTGFGAQAPAIAANSWHHIVSVYNASTLTVSIYVDGALARTENIPTPLQNVDNNGFLYLGVENPVVSLPSGPQFLTGKLDDIGIWSRALTSCEITQLFNTNTTTVPPLGSFTFNPLSDTSRACGTNTVLNAGSYASYSWNTGSTAQTITATSSGFYKVTVTNTAGCTASDSTYLSLVNANILNNDTTICLGSSIRLTIDSLFPNRTACSSAQLPEAMKNGLLAYYPFCGNANNALGAGNNGTIYNATLTTDRFGNANSAYNFNGTNAYIDFGANPAIGPTSTIPTSISLWVSGGASGNIISKYTNLDASRSYFFFGRSANEYSWVGNGTNPYIRNTTTPDATWTHYVLVGVAGSNNSKVYRNGVLIATGTLTMNTAMQAVSLLVGRVGASFPGYLNGSVDDIFIYNRELTVAEIQNLYLYQPTVLWSTGQTSNTITITPTQSRTYYVDISDGINTCRDSVRVNVSDLSSFNPLADTTRVCGTTATLNAGTGSFTYSWNTGAVSQSINPTTSGFYKVTVTNSAGCTANDSTYLSLVNARIINNDTTICRGSSVTLSIDSLFPGRMVCTAGGLPNNLRNGLVGYWPFCGNANDISGNANNGLASNVTLASDRFGTSNSAYLFNGSSSQILINSLNNSQYKPSTFSAWVKLNSYITGNYPLGGGYVIVGRDKANYGQQGAMMLYHYPSVGISNSFNYYVGSPVSPSSTNSYFTPNTNQWYHVAMTYSADDTISWYINGQLTRKAKFTFNSIDNIPFKIGAGDLTSVIGPRHVFDGYIDDVAYWSRSLTSFEVSQLYTSSPVISWSNGATSNQITVSPTQNTTYYVTVSDGINICTDSVKVTVSDIGSFNPLSDTTRVCGISTTLNAGPGHTTYSWNTGAVSQSINPTTSGFYKVTIANQLGCTASDSTILSIVKANIINNDTTICRGTSVTLSIDSLFPSRTVCTSAELPPNLRNGLVGYWPFCGNANDQSGNGFNGNPLNAILTTDRFNNQNSAYYFNGSASISVAHSQTLNITGDLSIASWVLSEGPPNFRTSHTFLCKRSPTEFNNFPYLFGINYQVNLPNEYKKQIFTSANNGSYQYIQPVPSITNNIWQFHCVTISGNQLKFYINGALTFNTTVDNSKRVANLANLLIGSGARTSIPDEFMLGKLDDLYLYNRSLSPDEVIQLYSGQYSVAWSDNSTTNSITVSPTQTTTYYVNVSDGITTCRDSVKITIADVDTALVILDPPQLCTNGGSVRMQAGFASSYQWLRNGVAIAGATSRSYTATQTGSYRVALVNSSGCRDSSRTVAVSLFPQPVSGFNINTATQCFAGNQFTFTNTTTLSSGSITHLWNFGNGITSTQISPSYSFPAAGTYLVKLVSTSTNGCKDSITRSVTVNSSPAATFTVNAASQCLAGNNFSFTNNSSISSGTLTSLWNFGDGTTATTSNSTYTYATAGTYSVKLVVTSSLGCKDSTTRTVTVFTKPTVDFTINTATQCFNNHSFVFTNTSTIASGTVSYIWRFGDGNTATTTNATYSYLAPGTYVVKLIATSNNGCADSVTRTLTVNPKPSIDFAINNPTQCLSGNQFVFSNNSTIASGTLAHRWNFGDGNTANTANATYAYTTAGTYTVTLVSTSALGCRDSLSRSVTVHAKPLVNFTVNSLAQCINTNSFVFTNTSTITPGTLSYSWRFGDGNGATTTNATYSYTNAGSYTVKLVATSNNGCADSTTRSVTVNPKPTVDFSINNNAQCLNVNQFVFNNNATISSGTLTHVWDFGNGITSPLLSPTYTYPAAGVYTVKLVSVSAEGCRDSSSRSVTVHAMPVGTLTPPATNLLCDGGVVLLSALGGNTYQWYLNGGALAGAINATHSANQPGLYTVNVISQNGCVSPASGSVTLQLVVKPTVNFTYNKYCAGFATQFTNQSNTANSNIVTYNWSFGAGQGTSQLENPTYIFPTAGTYNVSLTVTPVACPSLATSISKPVTAVAPPANQRYVALNAIENRDLALSARTYSGATYLWSPATGLSSALVAEPVFNYTAETEYVITITTGIGCVIKDTQLVRIFKAKEIYVPKGFSPNGDGNNDKIFPRLVGVRTLTYFKVFNRWGQLIYQTSNTNEGWDGTFRGVKQPMETFVWMAEGIDIDNNTIKRTGTFLLIR